MPRIVRRTALAGPLLALGLTGSASAQTITVFPTPNQPSFPFSIISGPDSNIWFMETFLSRIGRITPAGVITEFNTGALGAGDSPSARTATSGSCTRTAWAA